MGSKRSFEYRRIALVADGVTGEVIPMEEFLRKHSQGKTK